jgi:hypothetical protein
MLGERGLDLRPSEVGSVRNALANRGGAARACVEDAQLDEQHHNALLLFPLGCGARRLHLCMTFITTR